MEERIKYLFRQYLENKCSREELEELFSYIRTSEHDETLRLLIRKVYEDTEQMPSSLTYVNEEGHLVLTEKAWVSHITTPKRPARRRIAMGIGIVLLLVSAGMVWVWRRPSTVAGKPVIASLKKTSTDRSEYKYLLLPDSTQVWLNASSTLEFPDQFKNGKREVMLSGEAYFDVKHADRIPFIIHTGKISTTVLGTAFNIKAYPDRQHVIVSVSTGKVKVSYGNDPVAVLVKGQQVKVNSQYNTIEEKKIEPTTVAAWQQGSMSYDDESLEDIIADLERFYNVRIRIDNEAIRKVKVSTTFRREIGIEQALQVLCKLTDANLRQADGWWIIQ